MDKIVKWCRENAPAALQGLSDEELVSIMRSAYEESVSMTTKVSSPAAPVEEYLDFIYMKLAETFNTEAVFKGGYILANTLNPDIARRTTDIDLSIQNSELYIKLKTVFMEIAEHFKSLGIVDSYKIKDTIDSKISGGVKFYKDGKNIFGVDVGLHDLSYGVRTIRLHDLNSRAFTVERMLADKLASILSPRRCRRSKDLYDFFILTSTYKVDLVMLKEFLDLREPDLTYWPLSVEAIRELAKAYNKLIVRSILGIEISKPVYSSVLERIVTFVDTLYSGRDLHDIHWDTEGQYFRTDISIAE